MADEDIRNGGTLNEETVTPDPEFDHLEKDFLDFKGEVEFGIFSNVGTGSKVVTPPTQV